MLSFRMWVICCTLLEINGLAGYVFFSLRWRRYQCQWRAAQFRPILSAYGLWAGRDLYRPTHAVTRVPGFCALIRRTAPFSYLLLQVIVKRLFVIDDLLPMHKSVTKHFVFSMPCRFIYFKNYVAYCNIFTLFANIWTSLYMYLPIEMVVIFSWTLMWV